MSNPVRLDSLYKRVNALLTALDREEGRGGRKGEERHAFKQRWKENNGIVCRQKEWKECINMIGKEGRQEEKKKGRKRESRKESVIASLCAVSATDRRMRDAFDGFPLNHLKRPTKE